ncbi:MAG: CYTH domain-containing protein [Lachnospiraceae bacterium]|nr:CYTH domain-containing protein [Lachnospiraceae bacterium]
MEIERKFTLRTLPEQLEKYVSKKLEQGYLCTRPVVRVRKSVKEGKEKYILCYKSKRGLEKKADAKAHVCEEVELPLTKESYAKLLSKSDGRVITKTRYLIPYGAYTIELDVFEGELSGLMFAEVEFPNEEEADAFVMPEWFEADVTFDDRFRNNYLAQWAEAPKELRAAGIIK